MSSSCRRGGERRGVSHRFNISKVTLSLVSWFFSHVPISVKRSNNCYYATGSIVISRWIFIVCLLKEKDSCLLNYLLDPRGI